MVQSTPSFVDPFADVILVSSDGVEFPVAKAVMAMVSTVFEGMFQLPQNDGFESISDKQDSDKTVVKPHSSFSRIPVSEDSHTLDEFLSLIYRKKSVTIDEYTGEESQSIRKILDVAAKYDVRFIIEDVFRALLELARASPSITLSLQLYALACHHSHKDYAQKAGFESLRGDIVESVGSSHRLPEFDLVNANVFFRLLELHLNASRDISEAIEGCRSGCINCLTANSNWVDKWKSSAKAVVATSPLGDVFSSSFIFSTLVSLPSKCPHRPNGVSGVVSGFLNGAKKRIDDAVKKVCSH